MLIFSEGKKENSEKNQNLGYLTKWIFFVEILILVSGYVYALAHIWNGPSLDVIRALAWTLGIISLGHLLLLGYFSLYPQKRLFSFYLFAVMFGVSFLVFLNSSKTIIYDIQAWKLSHVGVQERIDEENAKKLNIIKIFESPHVIKEISINEADVGPVFILDNELKIKSTDIIISKINATCNNSNYDEKCENDRKIKMKEEVEKFRTQLVGKEIKFEIDESQAYFRLADQKDVYWGKLYYDGRLVDLNFSI